MKWRHWCIYILITFVWCVSVGPVPTAGAAVCGCDAVPSVQGSLGADRDAVRGVPDGSHPRDGSLRPGEEVCVTSGPPTQRPGQDAYDPTESTTTHATECLGSCDDRTQWTLYFMPGRFHVACFIECFSLLRNGTAELAVVVSECQGCLDFYRNVPTCVFHWNLKWWGIQKLDFIRVVKQSIVKEILFINHVDNLNQRKCNCTDHVRTRRFRTDFWHTPDSPCVVIFKLDIL